MNTCRWVRAVLPDYAAGRPAPGGEELAAHLTHCAACAAAERELRALFKVMAAAPAPPVPEDGAARARAALAEAAAAGPAAAERPCRERRRFLPLAIRLATGLVLGLALLSLMPRRTTRSPGAAVEAAVQRANTWHLVGWKLRGGKRVPWEIWGRRSPFFYREQLGRELNFDDGTQRVRLLPAGPNGRMLALRLQSGPAPSDMWRGWLTMGTGWRQARAWHETPEGILVYAGMDGGMQGPYSVAETYFTLDRRTWLPIRYEYRQHFSNSKAPAWVSETLQASYDVPIPDSVSTLRLPPGAVVADTLSRPTDPRIPSPDGSSVQRAHGLTVQVMAPALDPGGNILVRVRAWLGNLKLGAEGTATWNSVSTDVKYRSFGQTQTTAYHTDDGREYVDFQWPHVWLTSLTTGDALMLLAPLEPRSAGMALPRTLTLDLDMTPQTLVPGEMSSILFHQDFLFTIPLPATAAPIHIDDFLPPGHRQRFRFAPGADNSTLASNIDGARAQQYKLENNFDRSFFWQKRALAALPPFTNAAQLGRMAVADMYRQAGDIPHAAQWYRQVIAVSRKHPETWNYYAYQCRSILKYMATHPRRFRTHPRRPAPGAGRRGP